MSNDIYKDFRKINAMHTLAILKRDIYADYGYGMHKIRKFCADGSISGVREIRRINIDIEICMTDIIDSVYKQTKRKLITSDRKRMQLLKLQLQNRDQLCDTKDYADAITDLFEDIVKKAIRLVEELEAKIE